MSVDGRNVSTLFKVELDWRWYVHGVAVSPFHADRERDCVEDEGKNSH